MLLGGNWPGSYFLLYQTGGPAFSGQVDGTAAILARLDGSVSLLPRFEMGDAELLPRLEGSEG